MLCQAGLEKWAHLASRECAKDRMTLTAAKQRTKYSTGMASITMGTHNYDEDNEK